MSDTIEVSGTLPASPEALYAAWLDPEQHAAMTGAPATCEPGVGGRFTAWEGYIEGQMLELGPPGRIVQSWRTSDFPEGAPDSRLEVLLAAEGDGCRITFRHSGIPDGQGAMYDKGWRDYYLEPMAAWLAG